MYFVFQEAPVGFFPPPKLPSSVFPKTLLHNLSICIIISLPFSREVIVTTRALYDKKKLKLCTTILTNAFYVYFFPSSFNGAVL